QRLGLFFPEGAGDLADGDRLLDQCAAARSAEDLLCARRIEVDLTFPVRRPALVDGAVFVEMERTVRVDVPSKRGGDLGLRLLEEVQHAERPFRVIGAREDRKSV